MALIVAGAQSQWAPINGGPFALQNFTVSGGPLILFDWQPLLGQLFTGLRFVVVNTGAGVLTVTPEASHTGLYPEAGKYAPTAETVDPGTEISIPFGIDEMRPQWRLSVSGVSTGQWGVRGIPR